MLHDVCVAENVNLKLAVINKLYAIRIAMNCFVLLHKVNKYQLIWTRQYNCNCLCKFISGSQASIIEIRLTPVEFCLL